MNFQNARIFFLSWVIFFHGLVYNFLATADTINSDSNFTYKETLAIETNNEYTDKHKEFEETFQWLFNKVPYIKAQKADIKTIGNKNNDHGIEKFQPNFDTMDQKSYSYLLYYDLEESKYSYTISYVLFDSLYQDGILSNSYTFAKKDFMKAIKNIATDVYLEITGEFGFFIGKLFYTQRSQITGKQVLFSEDIDHNKVQYTSANTLLTSPTYCMGGRRIFISEKQKYTMNIQEINTIALFQTKVKVPQEINEHNLSSPEVSKDCKDLLFSTSDGTQSSIYKHSLINGTTDVVINNKNINTRPIFGSNGILYYISNKFGTPKIFSTHNGATQIISRGMGSYIYISISPNLQKIAFVKIFSGSFYVGTMNIDGSNEILLKKGYIVEAPSWSPIGNNIIVTIQDRKKPSTRKVYSISTLTGLAYQLRISHPDIVQANWVVDNNDTINNQYHF